MIDASAPILVEQIHKRFGKLEALRGVDLEVPAGSIFGFLGLNGAGKTTLIRTLLGLLQPDSGRCSIAGLDPRQDSITVRGHIGYMAENQTMYAWMRVGQIIEWVGRFHPGWDANFAENLRQQMRLNADARIGTLSKGQSSRLALLLALAHHPRTVILDDPTLGLDPVARRDFLRDVIGHLQSTGATVFFSSHLLYEIEPICDRVAILHEGRIIKAAAVDELRDRIKRVLLPHDASPRLAEIPGLLDVQSAGGKCTLTVDNIEAARPALATMGCQDFSVMDLNLDEIFEAYVIGRRELPHA